MSKFIMSPLKLPNAKREESPYTFPSEVFGSKAGEEIMPGVVRAVAADEARRVAAAYGASFREVRLDAPEETLLAPILRMLKTIAKNAEIEEMRSPSSTGDGVAPRVTEIIQHARGSRLSVALGEPGFVFDVTLCGDGFVGKSSLIAALMNRSNQPPSHKYVETPDVILHKYSFEVDDLQVQLRIRDINGVLATEQLTRDNILDTQCILFIYDVYSRDSFNRLQELRAHIETCKQDKRWAIVLVANKVDGRDAVLFSRPVVSPEEGRALAQSWNCPYVETSARDDSASELFRMAIREVRHVYGMTSSETVSTDAHGYVNLKVKNKFKKYYAALHHGMFSWRSKDTDKKPKAAVEITHDSAVSHNGMSDKAGYVLALTVRGDNNVKQVIQLGTQSALELEQWSMALNAEIGVRRVFRNMLADQMRPIFREILQDSPYTLGSTPLAARSSNPLGGSDHISATKAASTLALTNASKRKSNLIAPADLDKVLRKKKIDSGHL
jgi:small GTP-binding protein